MSFRSPSVTMPISRPCSTTGSSCTWYLSSKSRACCSESSGPTVTGAVVITSLTRNVRKLRFIIAGPPRSPCFDPATRLRTQPGRVTERGSHLPGHSRAGLGTGPELRAGRPVILPATCCGFECGGFFSRGQALVAAGLPQALSSGQPPIQPQHHDRTEDGHEIPGLLLRAVPSHQPGEKPADKGPGDAEPDGDDKPAGVPPRHEEFGDHADDQSEKDPT